MHAAVLLDAQKKKGYDLKNFRGADESFRKDLNIFRTCNTGEELIRIHKGLQVAGRLDRGGVHACSSKHC